MARKKKLHGNLFEYPGGGHIRVKAGYMPLQRLLYRNAPRGKTGAAWSLTSFLKRISPLIYVFIVKELRKSPNGRHPKLQQIIEEWKTDAARPGRPTARELAAFVVERGMDGAWETWGLKRPYKEGEPDSFYRRYIQGHAGAIGDYREALNMPEPRRSNHLRLTWVRLGPSAWKDTTPAVFSPASLSQAIR